LIDDIGLDELVAVVVLDAAQRFEIAGIGQLVEVQDLMSGIQDQVPYKRRADKTGTASDENAHPIKPFSVEQQSIGA
jgi:hypothetical protein